MQVEMSNKVTRETTGRWECDVRDVVVLGRNGERFDVKWRSGLALEARVPSAGEIYSDLYRAWEDVTDAGTAEASFRNAMAMLVGEMGADGDAVELMRIADALTEAAQYVDSLGSEDRAELEAAHRALEDN